MEKILETILEEIKGVKEEVQEIREEVKESKQELRDEMQEMKKELQDEMQDMKKELKTELRAVEIFLEKRDNELKDTLKQTIEVQNEILKELRINREEHKVFNSRLDKIELRQDFMEEELLKIS